MRVWIVGDRIGNCLVSEQKPVRDDDGSWYTWEAHFSIGSPHIAEELFGEIPDEPKQVQLIGMRT